MRRDQPLTSSSSFRLRQDMGYPSRTECALAKLRLATLRHQMMELILLAIPNQRKRANTRRIRPMCCRLAIFERFLLTEQILLRHIAHRHVARVSCEAQLRSGGAQVVVRCTRVPYHQVAWIHTDLLTLQAFVCKPLHTGDGEAVPVFGPGSRQISQQPVCKIHKPKDTTHQAQIRSGSSSKVS